MPGQSTVERLKAWARSVRRDVFALYLAARDPRVSGCAKLLALATAAYALSPIDLIPDFIPILGYLDDLVIIPIAIRMTVALIPDPLMADLRSRADQRLAQTGLPTSRTAAIVIVVIWLAFALLIIRLLAR